MSKFNNNNNNNNNNNMCEFHFNCKEQAHSVRLNFFKEVGLE